MKQIKISIAAVVILAGSFLAFKAQDTGSIKGSVSPADAAVKVWAISATDTLQSAISNGAFEIRDAREGSYRVIVEATPPFKNAAKENVTVTAGNATDIGTITLSE